MMESNLVYGLNQAYLIITGSISINLCSIPVFKAFVFVLYSFDFPIFDRLGGVIEIILMTAQRVLL